MGNNTQRASKKLFKLAKDHRKSDQQSDARGTVVVKVMLVSTGHNPVKGNIVRTMRLEASKVSEVYKAFMELVQE